MSPVLRKQVGRVGRRLFLQTLLDCLAWCWAVALVVSVCWFLAQPFLVASPPEWLRWAVAGGALGVCTLAAVVLAFLWSPSRLVTALALDERFNLKERVTTSLTLTPALEHTPAGQALLADVTQQVGKIDVGTRFPVRVRWTAALVPVGATALALVAVFYHPNLGTVAAGTTGDDKKPIQKAEELAKKMEKLAKKPSELKSGEKVERSRELEKIEAELRDLVNKPRDTREQLRERAKEMTELEGAVMKREKELRDKAQAIKDQLKNIDRFNKKDGMTKDLEKALEKGDFNKAKDEVEKLAKKMQENQLDKKEQEELGKKLDEMKQKLERMAKQSDQEEKLREMHKQGKLDAEQLERELDNLKKNRDNLKKLDELAKQLQQCKECMEKGDGKQAAESLKRAAERLKELGGDDKEMEELQDKLEQLQDARRQAGDSMGDPQPVPGSGRRPEDKDGDFKPLPSRVKLDFDKDGRKEIIDFVPGKAYKKKSSSEIAGEVKQASQEAPEALERQRFPRAASDIARGYYDKLREQAEREQK